MTRDATEASTLAAFVRLVGRVIAERGVDAGALMRRSGIDPDRLERPGERVSRTAMTRLWALAVAETGDPAIGLTTRLFQSCRFPCTGSRVAGQF